MAAEQRAAQPGDEPGDREGGELDPCGRDRHRRRGLLVLTHADDHPSDTRSSEMPDGEEHDDERQEQEVVVGTVPVGQVEGPEVGPWDAARSTGRR